MQEMFEGQSCSINLAERGFDWTQCIVGIELNFESLLLICICQTAAVQVTKNEKNKHVNEKVTKSKQIREITMSAVLSLNLKEYVNLCYKKNTMQHTD